MRNGSTKALPIERQTVRKLQMSFEGESLSRKLLHNITMDGGPDRPSIQKIEME